MAIELDNKNTLRKFKLERLTYGSLKPGEEFEEDAEANELYNFFTGYQNPYLTEFNWVGTRNNKEYKHFRIKLSNLDIGEVKRLRYRAQVRLCKLIEGQRDDECEIVEAKDATEAKDVQA